MKRNPITAAELARLDAVEAASWPPRIARALEQLARAGDPYRARSTDGGTAGGSSDPTGTTAANVVDDELDRLVRHARADRKALIDAVVQRDRYARTLARVLDEWAPIIRNEQAGATSNASTWCVNHRKHGRNEPRSIDGSRNCRWCCDVERHYGKPPTAALINMHAEGRRISDGEYRAALGLAVGA